ncbi:hypothetical protein Zmor_008274 [Zophobas morio]|uniref:Odorant receptor n=1 Tax=Zophobas morio TaxID=2755281 RepID=A0AA38J113_9CUCU|nr:hypothetical protein Zmor_008274 [Zophobas morio]
MFLPTWQKPKYDDCMWLFRIICLDIFRTKPVKRLLNILLCTIILQTILQSIIFLQISTRPYWIKFSSMYCSSFFIIISIYSTPRIADAVINCLESSDVWPINATSRTIEQKIKLEVLYLNTFLIVSICMSLTGGVLHTIPLDDDREIFYTIAMIEDYLPQWKNVLCFMYRSSFLILPLLMGTPFYIAIYMCCQMRFQIYMLLHLWESLDQKLITNITDDEKYNEMVKKVLVLSIQKNSRIQRTLRKLINDFKHFVFLFTVVGALQIICLIFFVISFEGSLERRYSRFAMMTIPSGLVFIHVIVNGQMVEDITNRAFDEVLKSLDWSRWNKENKKLYLIVLSNNQKPLKLKFSESVSLNYKLGLGILKSTYSIVSLLWYLKKKSDLD